MRYMLLACAIAAFSGCTRQTPVEEISADEARQSEASEYQPAVTDWPWWRGPQKNGHANSAALSGSANYPVTWDSETNVIWKVEIPGRGHSSPTIVGDRIYLSSADDEQQIQAVMALDRATGESVWRTSVHKGKFPGRGRVHSKSTNANCTVACDGEHVFVAFLNDDSITATALTVDGEIKWQKKLGAFDSKFGYAPSPTIYKSLVIFAADNQGGGYLAALDRHSGEIVWRKARPALSSYSSPIVATVAGRDQLLISGCDVVASYDPATGDKLWSVPGTTEATCGTMVWNKDHVFASGGYPEKQTICINAADTPKAVWDNRQKCYEQSMLLDGENLYSVTDDGIFFCWNALTGEENWKKRLGGPVSASPILADGHIYLSNERGVTFVLNVKDGANDVVAKNQLGTESFATPTLCDGRIYLRVANGSGADRTEMLYCIGSADDSET